MIKYIFMGLGMFVILFLAVGGSVALFIIEKENALMEMEKETE